MTRGEVQRWLDAYVDAWRSYDPAAIAALFSDGATYAYQPYREPVRGRDAIVADWLESPDAAGSWDAKYEAYAADDDRAVAVGQSKYFENGKLATLYYNVWLLRFDADGRCTEFVEYWREHPKEQLPAG